MYWKEIIKNKENEKNASDYLGNLSSWSHYQRMSPQQSSRVAGKKTYKSIMVVDL